MKKSVVLGLATIVLLLSGSLSAQVQVGLIGGINFADINSDMNYSNRMDYSAGCIMDVVLSNDLTVSVEPMYIKKGGLQEATFNQPEGDIIFSYIEVPVLLKYTFKNSDGPYLTVGPSVSYLLDSDVEMRTMGFTFTGDAKSITQKWDYGLTFGGGFKMPLGKFSIIAECRYSVSLYDLAKEGSFDVRSGDLVETIDTEAIKMKNQGLRVLMGVSYTL